jgi:hypothetical protein
VASSGGAMISFVGCLFDGFFGGDKSERLTGNSTSLSCVTLVSLQK